MHEAPVELMSRVADFCARRDDLIGVLLLNLNNQCAAAVCLAQCVPSMR
jgi:hypothetical protein